MARIDRHQYYCSREWALLKRIVQERSRGMCERCRRGTHDETHHLTYERFGHENPEDLQALCTPCHEFVSGRSNFDPAARVPDCLHCTPSATYNKIIATGKTLTQQIDAAEARGDDRRVEKLLKRKAELIKVQADHAYFVHGGRNA